MDLSIIDTQSILLRSTNHGQSLAQLSDQQKMTTKQKKKQEKITEKKSEPIFLQIVTKNVRKKSVLKLIIKELLLWSP